MPAGLTKDRVHPKAIGSKRRSVRAQADERLLVQIQAIHAQSRATYGSPRVTHSLRLSCENVGHNRVARLMRQAGLVGCQL
jgi:putative transposase